MLLDSREKSEVKSLEHEKVGKKSGIKPHGRPGHGGRSGRPRTSSGRITDESMGDEDIRTWQRKGTKKNEFALV